VYLVTDASGVVSRALEIWQADFDPINHRDIYRWSIADPKYGLPSIGFTPNYSIEVGGYRIRYPQPLVVTGAFPFELLTAPESALRAGDALLGWINRSGAGDTIDVEQLNEPPYWGGSASNPIDDPNVRLQALIDAASRGTKVRLLLDRYFDDPLKLTSNAATVQYIESLRAISPTLYNNLEVRLGDPALYGLHSKLFLFNVGERKVIHVGSLNGTETSNKVNREVALQVESSAAAAGGPAVHDAARSPIDQQGVLSRFDERGDRQRVGAAVQPHAHHGFVDRLQAGRSSAARFHRLHRRRHVVVPARQQYWAGAGDQCRHHRTRLFQQIQQAAAVRLLQQRCGSAGDVAVFAIHAQYQLLAGEHGR